MGRMLLYNGNGDFATAASQNGFHKLSLNKKTKINKKMTNNIRFFLSLSSFIIEQSCEEDHY